MPDIRFDALKDVLLVAVQVFTLWQFIKATRNQVNEPYRIQDDRISHAERRLDVIEQKLTEGSDHFKKLDSNSEIMNISLLVIQDALISMVSDEKVKASLESVKEKVNAHLAGQATK